MAGSVEFARILAGYDFSLRPANADASIGLVEVDGDWVASDLVAGAAAGADAQFGTDDDTRIPGGSPRRLARIASLASAGPSRARSPCSTTSASSPSWSAR